MPIVFAAVVPHNPLLMASIAKDHHRFSHITREAIGAIASELYARQVQTLVVLTPHGDVIPGSLVLSVSPTLTGRLSDFGDPRPVVQVAGAAAFAQAAKEVFEDAEVPVQLQTFPELDYGCTVPLSFLPVPRPGVLPVHVASQPRSLLLRFGQALYQASHRRTERIGVIASADLVRRTEHDPNGRPVPVERTLGHILSAVDLSQVSALPEDEKICGLNPVITLMAMLAPLRAHGTIRSFEVVTHVGLMTATFDVGT